MKTLIKNARIISPGIDMPGAAVEMEGKTITAVYPAGSELPAADKVVDAEGRMLLPGFIDIHSHGAGGCDTCDAKLESLRTIAECKMKEGVTSWLPTTLTLSPKVLEDVCASVAEYMKNQEFAKTPGVHLEGPFINPKCCGAQNPAFVRQPDYDEVANLNSIARVLLVSLAPEMPGAIELQLVRENQGEPMELQVIRHQETIKLEMTPVETEDGSYKLGIWVRDNIQGIGTLTYVEPNGTFGALGHGISDLSE